MTDIQNADDDVLGEFFGTFTASFRPPMPSRGKSGTIWNISRAWTEALRRWLDGHYAARYELPLSRRRRLDAALCRKSESRVLVRDVSMDIALEWEWDNTKVAKDFPRGDFRKLFEVNARCGVAIVQTRVDGLRGTRQAEETVDALRHTCVRRRRDERPVGLIELRRTRQTRDDVEFECYIEDMVRRDRRRTAYWRYLDRPALKQSA